MRRLLLCSLSFLLLSFSLQAQLPLRIAADSAVRKSAYVPDLNNNSASLSFVRGDDVLIEVGLFQNGHFVTNLNSYTNLVCQIFSTQNSTSGPLMAQSVTNGTPAWNANCAYAGWISNSAPDTNWHAQFYFPDTQTSIPLNGQASQTYWMRLAAGTTNNRTVTFLEGPVTIYDGPISPDYIAPGFPASLAVDQYVNLYPPQTNFFAQNSNLLNQAVNGAHGGGSGNYDPRVIATNGSGQITVAGTLSNISAQVSTSINGGGITNVPVTAIVGAPSTNIVRASATVTPDSLSGAPLILVVGPDGTNHAVTVFSNAPVFYNGVMSLVDATVGAAFFYAGSALSHFTNLWESSPAGWATPSAISAGAATFGGLLMQNTNATFANGHNSTGGGDTNYALGFFGNGPGLTNLQSTNVLIVSSSNDVTSVNLLSGTNWPVVFNRDYWTFVSNNICISNCQNLNAAADNWVNIFLRVTNIAQTVYVSWAPWPSGAIPILNGFTNGWPLIFSQGYYHLCGHIFGTNWATNAEWELTNPSL